MAAIHLKILMEIIKLISQQFKSQIFGETMQLNSNPKGMQNVVCEIKAEAMVFCIGFSSHQFTKAAAFASGLTWGLF